jgi:hypothetical protein
VEDVLIYMAREIVRVGETTANDFAKQLNQSIWYFPGNAYLKKKTVDNWRTEISALFGLISKNSDTVSASKLAQNLADNLDLISFFRTYLAKFQYPGGHVRADFAAECIEHGVRFKPAAFLIKVLLSGQAQSDSGKFWIDKMEATALIWNDLRVTSGELRPEDVAQSVIRHRLDRTAFDGAGDVTRYAGDLLDYMVLAEILNLHPNGRYTLLPGLQDAANMILSNESFFVPYEHLYSLDEVDSSLLSGLEQLWFNYAGNEIENMVLDTDPLSLLQAYSQNSDSSPGEAPEHLGGSRTSSGGLDAEMLQFLRDKLIQGQKVRTKDTGDAGEFIVLKHEFNRLNSIGAHEQAKKVKKIPDHLGVGFDIKSFLDASEAQKLIEVKTSLSHGRLRVSQFHLTKNEWRAAEVSGEHYYVYRILISSSSVSCFVIQDPVEKYKSHVVKMVIGDGADIQYTNAAGSWEQLMLS